MSQNQDLAITIRIPRPTSTARRKSCCSTC